MAPRRRFRKGWSLTPVRRHEFCSCCCCCCWAAMLFASWLHRRSILTWTRPWGSRSICRKRYDLLVFQKYICAVKWRLRETSIINQLIERNFQQCFLRRWNILAPHNWFELNLIAIEVTIQYLRRNHKKVCMCDYVCKGLRERETASSVGN